MKCLQCGNELTTGDGLNLICQECNQKNQQAVLFGKHCSDERKKNISNSLKGSIPWKKGKKNIYSEETLQKMRKEKTKETKEKLSLIAKQRYGTRKRNERGQFA